MGALGRRWRGCFIGERCRPPRTREAGLEELGGRTNEIQRVPVLVRDKAKQTEQKQVPLLVQVHQVHAILRMFLLIKSFLTAFLSVVFSASPFISLIVITDGFFLLPAQPR